MTLPESDRDDGLSLFSDMHAEELAAANAAAAGPADTLTAVPTEQPAPIATTTGPLPGEGDRGGSTPAPQTPATPTTPQRQTAVRDMLRARGFDYGDDVDDDAVMNELLEAATLARDAEQIRPLIAHGQRYQQHAPVFEQWLAQYQSGQQPQAPAQPATTQPAQQLVDPNNPLGAWEQAPEMNPEWLRVVEKNEHGDLVIAKRYVGIVDPTIPQKLMKAIEWEQDRGRTLARDYPKLTEQLVEKKFQSYQDQVRQAAREIYAEERVAEEIESFVSANKQHLFVLDANGRPKVDPHTGQNMRAPFGQLVNAQTKALLTDYYQGAPFEQLPASEKRKVMKNAFASAAQLWNAHQARHAAPQPQVPAETPAAALPAPTPAAADPQDLEPNPAGERPRDARGRFIENAVEHARQNPGSARPAGDGAARRDQQLDDEDDDKPISQIYAEENARQRNGHAARV